MKLSEAKVKGYQLRDIDETCEFYTKEVTIISKQSEDDSFGTATSWFNQYVEEDVLYLDDDYINNGDYFVDSYAYDDNVIEFYIPEFDLNSKNFEKALTDKFKEVEFNKDNKVLKIVDESNYYGGYSKAVLNNKYDENGNLSNTVIDRSLEVDFFGTPVSNISHLEINHKDGLLLDVHNKTINNEKESYLDYKVDYDEENNKSYINGTMTDSEKIEKLDDIECFYANDNFSKPELYLTKDENGYITRMSTIDYDTNPAPLEYAKRIDTIAIRNHSENITPDSYNDYLDVTSTRMK